MSSGIYRGDPIAPGFAVGDLQLLGRTRKCGQIAGVSIADPSVEADRFRRQVDSLAAEIAEAVERLESECFLTEAQILRAHLAILGEPCPVLIAEQDRSGRYKRDGKSLLVKHIY